MNVRLARLLAWVTFLIEIWIDETEKDWIREETVSHERRGERGARISREKRRVLAALQKLFTRPVAEGNADEQLLFHLFDILFKCFTCRDVQIPRDKAGERFLLSRRYRDIASSWIRRRVFIKSVLAECRSKVNSIFFLFGGWTVSYRTILIFILNFQAEIEHRRLQLRVQLVEKKFLWNFFNRVIILCRNRNFSVGKEINEIVDMTNMKRGV